MTVFCRITKLPISESHNQLLSLLDGRRRHPLSRLLHTIWMKDIFPRLDSAFKTVDKPLRSVSGVHKTRLSCAVKESAPEVEDAEPKPKKPRKAKGKAA